MLMKLLEIRTVLLKIYQKGRWLINPLVKFILSFMVFTMMTDAIGYDSRFADSTILALLSVICAILPGSVLVFFTMLLSLVHVYSVSPFLAAIMLLAYLVLYGMLMRFTPKYALVAVAIPVLAKYNLHYCVPLILGCISNPLTILPTIAGVFIYYMISIVKAAAAREVTMDLDDIIQLFTDIADAIMANKQMFIMMIVFSLVIATVFLIRKFAFDHAFAVSIGAGMLVNIMGFLVADLRYDVTVNIGALIGMTLVSGAITLIVEYMKRVLDYTGVEQVQFEDDDYYYYVKAVPKVNVSIPSHMVHHLGSDDGDEEDGDGDGDSDGDIYNDRSEDDGAGSFGSEENRAEEAMPEFVPDIDLDEPDADSPKQGSTGAERGRDAAAGIRKLGARFRLIQPDAPADYEEDMSLEDDDE